MFLSQDLSKPVVDTGIPQTNEIESETKKILGDLSRLRSYPSGRASRVRADLIRCEGLLAQSGPAAALLSRISISALGKAASDFLRDVRVSGGPVLSEDSFFSRGGASGNRFSRKPPEDYEHRLARQRRERAESRLRKKQL